MVGSWCDEGRESHCRHVHALVVRVRLKEPFTGCVAGSVDVEIVRERSVQPPHCLDVRSFSQALWKITGISLVGTWYSGA